mgnify:CR=1 FL=1
MEAYRLEKLNRPKSPEVKRFEEIAEETLAEEGKQVESYNELRGILEGMEEGEFVISELDLYETEVKGTIIAEKKDLLSWLKAHKGQAGKWIIVNGEIFDVEWRKGDDSN